MRRTPRITRAGFLFFVLAIASVPAAARTVQSPEPSPAPPPPAEAAAAATPIRFSFKGATFEQVVDFFARETGLPVVWETDPPAGTLDYLSPRAYDLPEALRVLNIILQAKGVMLRAKDGMLYLQQMKELQREDIPTFVGALPESVTDDQVVTLVVPLRIAIAATLAEKLAPMAASYGAVTPLEQQNAIIVTETAAQVRRFLKIINELDREDPEGAVEIIPVRHTEAKLLMEPLKALLSQTVERIVLDNKKKPKTIRQQEMSGLNITFDDRTNSIIAKGLQSRIDKLKDTLLLLDVPGAGKGRSIRTFTPAMLTPQQAADAVGKLFAAVPEKERPSVVAMEANGTVTVIGSRNAIAEAEALLADLDGDPPATPGGPVPPVTVLALDHARPDAIISGIEGLLAPGQRRGLRLRAGPDGRSVVVSGSAADVASVAALVPVLDRAPPVGRTVRLLRLTSHDARALVNRARDLYGRQLDANATRDDPAHAVDVELDAAGRTLTLIGAPAALDAFATVLRSVEDTTVADRETRVFDVAHRPASDVAGRLRTLAAKVLAPRDGRSFEPPAVEPIDELDRVIVTAEPGQLDAIASLVDVLDAPTPADYAFRIVALDGVTDVERLLARAETMYADRTRGYEPGAMPPPAVEHDADAGRVVLRGTADAVALYETVISDARGLLPPARTGRIVAVTHGPASDLVEPLLDMLARTAPSPSGRDVAPPDIEVLPRTNGLHIVAEPEQHRRIDEALAILDVVSGAAMPPLNVLQVQGADPARVAALLQSRYDGRPPAARLERPVSIEVDAGTRTLFVSADETLFREIAEFVETLNKAEGAGGDRRTMVFSLRHARADDIAGALERLYPAPPVPVDWRGRPQPHLQPPPEVRLTMDGATNTLIVEAPAGRRASITALVEELDRTRVGAEAVEVRLLAVRQADPAGVAATVRAAMAARSGGRPGVPVPTIEVEETSRTLVISAIPEQLREIETLVRELDQRRSADDVQVRTVLLRHGRAERIAPIVLELLAGEEIPLQYKLDAARRRITLPETGPAIRVAADERLNAIIISAPSTLAALAEEMVAQLDVDPAATGGARAVHVLRVENADASEIAENLEAMFADDAAGESAPTIRVDRASNSLLVRASESQLRVIGEIVAQIDRATISAAREMRTISIDPSKARAEDVARALERMLDRSGRSVEIVSFEELLEERRRAPAAEEEPGATRTPRVPVDIGPRPLYDVMAAMVFAMVPADDAGSDEPPALDPAVARFLAFLHAYGAGEEVEREAARPLAQPERRVGQPAPVPPSAPEAATDSAAAIRAALEGRGDVTIAVDPATNSLVVIGAPPAVDRVVAFAEQVQDQLPPEPSRVRYLALPAGADAAALARLIDQTIRQLTPPGGRRGQMRERIALVADTTSNALVVAANDADYRMIGDLVAAFARPPALDPTVIKIYPLTRLAADRAAVRLDELLAPDPRGGGRRRQALKQMPVRLLAGEEPVDAVLAPERINVSADTEANALIVMAPGEAIPFIDRFIEMIDEAPVNVQSTLKLYPLRHARAEELRRSLRDIFRSRFRSRRAPSGVERIAPEFVADSRTNTLLVTAAPEQLAEVDDLLARLDRDLGEEQHPLRVIELEAALPSQTATLLERVVIGTDQERKAATVVVPDDASGVLLVRAAPEVSAEIDRVLAEIDRDAARGYDVRTLTVERADPSAVAAAIQRFYDDRARIASAGRGRRAQARRVSIVGDAASRTLLVAASDEDFAEIEDLVARFDSPQATSQLSFRVFSLRHAKATEIEETVNQLVGTLMWNQYVGPGGRRQGPRRDPGSLAVRADARLNALIATGEGDQFEMIEQLVEVLDVPTDADGQRVVKLYRLEHAGARMVADVVQELYTDTSRRWWEPPDPSEVRIRVDEPARTLIVSGTVREHAEIAAVIASIDGQVAPEERTTAVLRVEYANARDVGRTLERFLDERADAGGAASTATILASESARSLVVSAAPAELATIRDLLSRLDEPDLAGDRAIEIMVLRQGDAEEIGRIVREQFGRRGTQSVIVTADVRTNSLVVNAPPDELARARGLIERLDSPGASDETIIRTYSLAGAQAQEVVRILSSTLQLDARGETRGITIKLDDASDAVEVNATIVADRRSNSLVVTATAESIPVIESLISQLDEVPAASPIEYRIIALEHAMADDVAWTLRQVGGWGDDGGPRPGFDYSRLENQLIVSATADQFEQILQIVDELDQPSARQRVTDFVPLQFAEAQKVQEALEVFYGPYALEADTPSKRNVSIVADPATNSLVISADEAEWADIRELLGKLDSEEYDASLQLHVIPLMYADATSVARAINEAFREPAERDRRAAAGRERDRPGGTGEPDRREASVAPTVLVESEEWVRASAETQTNSLIVSASRPNFRKIEQIVTQLDVADYAQLPAPRLIPVTSGDPEGLARALERLYVTSGPDRGRKGLRIVGDPGSNTIIVRAEEEEFAQIKALAASLQQESSEAGVAVEVIRLTAAPARRVANAISDAYEAKARRNNQPFSIEVDVAGNSLVVASTAHLIDEVRATAAELDAMAPGAGQGIFIIELEHVAPEEVRSIVETIGLDRPVPDDAQSRLVSEPIRVSVLAGRRAVVVVANPADRDTVVALVKALDAAPEMAEAQMRVITLRHAEAEALARVLEGVLDPTAQQAATPLARAVEEQVRRLSVRRQGLDEPDLALDLTQPVRVLADAAMNALVVSSTPENLDAIVEIVAMFDRLPITDAVTVQLFPLRHIAAGEFVRIVGELFEQGKRLATVPGTDIRGVPGGMVGLALLDEIAISTDERTNTVVVAGKEDSVALVEVLVKRLDSEIAAGWVEPRLIRLRYADANDLAETLGAVLVEGTADLPQASPLQRQVGRLRLMREAREAGPFLESEVFQPMSRLVIRAEAQLNAIILVGTPTNLEVVTELVAMLDVEAASPDATVRLYPVRHASAERVGVILTRLFDEQAESKAIRPEDRVIVQADARTNALIVTTSPRSFAVLETLLDALDTDIGPDLREIRSIELAHATANRVGQLVQELMDARLERLRRVQPETAELEQASVVADPRTNRLFVAAGDESFAVIAQLVAELDRRDGPDDALVDVLPLTHGNADRIRETIDAIMDRRYADLPAELRAAQKPLIMTDPRTNSLLVAAGPEDLADVRSLVTRLEAAPADPAVGLHVVSVPAGASATQLAPRLQRLMREREQSLGPARQPSDAVTIEPDPVGNALIVAASAENARIVEGLLEVLLDAGLDALAGRAIEVLPLTASRAGDVLPLLRELYIDEANRTRGDGTVQATADERINAVIVSGAPMDVTALRGLVRELDGAKPATVVEIKYLALESANALETVNLIESILSGRGIGATRGTQQATVLKYLRELDDGTGADPAAPAMEVSAAIRESINLTPDVRTNTIVVSAPPASMKMIERMVRDLDASSTGAKAIRVFKLDNADATAMAEILTDLFNLRQGSDTLVLKPREGEELAPAAGARDFAGTPLTAVPDARQQLSITVDSRTNSLLVSGTPRYLDLVSDVVVELDGLKANERETFIYPLLNAQALDVATVLGEFAREEQEKLISTLGTDQIGSAARLLEREITIRGEEKSNTVLVSASPRYMERVKAMIRQLDVDPPQVLIQVLLAEITLDSADDWGVDMTVSGRAGSATVTAGFGLASAFVTGMGVPNISIASADFNLLIRAMQAQGRLQVLSNPSIMAANNERAFIQVGETIRVPEATSFTDSGSSNTSLTVEDLGIILEVVPTINPDGYVRLQVQPTISSLSGRTTQINEDLSSPIITRRTAETTVTVHDGQTIVIGGLISDRFERRDRKVPFLGDLPLLGGLFRSESEETAKTELVIVLTPHVIESPTDRGRVDDLTEGEINRLTLPASLKERIREGLVDLSGGLFDAQGRPLDIDHDE